MAKGALGFGWMRLPQRSSEPTDFDYEQINRMVDCYLEAGFDYFDTSYVYHNGGSEMAIQKCLVSRYPRDRYRLASKLPTFAITEEAQVEQIFTEQLNKCGVDYFDYYLLHNVNSVRYRQVIADCHMFEHLKAWKTAGKIRHIAFSFHDTADVLDQILLEHPEVEAVQIALNYIDWDAYFVQAKSCYDIIRKHGRQVIVMEPVKGGMLAKVPAEAEELMKREQPDASPVSWALRFAASLDGVLAVLSGMSTIGQVEENVAVMRDFHPMSVEEKKVLSECAKIYRRSGPVGTDDFGQFEGVNPRGVSAAAILDTYNSCMLQPVPTFGAEHNYFAAEKAKCGLHQEDLCIPGQALLSDGRDVTAMVHEAETFLNEYSFFQYDF